MPRPTYKIHPAIAVARVGNHLDSFYVEPTAAGGLPTEYDAGGQGPEVTVTRFKEGGMMRRQAARFRVFRYDTPTSEPQEVNLANGGLKSVRWTVHIANKKAAWRTFSELAGDLMLGESNSYEARSVPWNNATVTGTDARRALITDPGPRTLAGASQGPVEFDAHSREPYAHVSFPPAALDPYNITTLGRAWTDTQGALFILGGFGNSGGPSGSQITTFTGGDGWYDDVSDGPVTAEIETADGQRLELDAWIVVGAPKVAPELTQISSLADSLVDTAVRYLGACPALFDPQTGFKPNYQACLERDVLPVLLAMKEYRWVADVDPMVSFATPPFDVADLSEANRPNREAWFQMLRNPGNGLHQPPEQKAIHQVPFADNGFPLMPMNAGDNPIRDLNIEKFVALTPTQYFLLGQWAKGRCDRSPERPLRDWTWIHPLDYASTGNVVGLPMCPGIEVTWSLRNPIVLNPVDPMRIKRQPTAAYNSTGLDPSRDETEPGSDGCQPGDLTKRMAIPWQADFFDCSIQNISYASPSLAKVYNNATGFVPPLPTFYAYWRPAQSPWNVYNGADNAVSQALDGAQISQNNFIGQQVLYHRGINSFNATITAWKYLGFILNRTQGPLRRMLPFYVETERNYEAFVTGVVTVDDQGVVHSSLPVQQDSLPSLMQAASPLSAAQYLVGP